MLRRPRSIIFQQAAEMNRRHARLQRVSSQLA